MYCINIHLNIDLFTFHKHCICKLLYMIGTHYNNKMLFQKLFFCTIFMDLLIYSSVHKTHPKFTDANKVV